jgi:histidinol-phosphatase
MLEPTTQELAADLALALELADIADQVTMSHYLSGNLQVTTKADMTPVTEADKATEAALRDRLGVARPGEDVLGEEFGGQVAAAGRQWIIDPIDATKNYLRGVPVWATLVALCRDGEAVVGVASAPALGRRWWAARGLGAFCGPAGGAPGQPRPLACSGVKTLQAASFSFSDQVGWPPGALARLMDAVWRVRAYGDFWSHLMVAEGAIDLAAEPELSVWDFAALIPIVTEAGGRIAGFDGTVGLAATSALTTNGHLDAAARELLLS